MKKPRPYYIDSSASIGRPRLGEHVSMLGYSSSRVDLELW